MDVEQNTQGSRKLKKNKNEIQLDTSPVPLTLVCRMLKGDKAVTFLVVVINMAVQLFIFLIHLHSIIDNYYDPSVSKEAPFDYFMHHSCFFLFVAFECLVVGLSLWLIVHTGSSIARWLLDFTLTQLRSHFHSPGSRSDVEHGRQKKYTHHHTQNSDGRLQRLGQGCLSLISRPEILVIGLVETVLFVVCALEAKLLADMAVHFIDLDLVDVMGLKTVLERQHQLGAGIADEHWKYIHLIIILLLTGQIVVYYIARFLDGRLPTKQKAKLFLTLLMLALALFAIAPYEHRVLSQRPNHFRGLLPFNFFDREATQDLVPIQPRLNHKFPPQPGEGYPAISNSDPNKQDQRLFPRIVGKRRNIVVLAQESFRRSELANFSPKTRAFVNEHKCIEPKLAAPAGHVTEMSWFGILYGIYSYHHHSFGINHIISYPLEVLERNDYVTTLITASICWPYPNKNILANVQELYSDENNLEVFASLRKFVASRKEDKKNFFLYLTLHKSIEEYTNDPQYRFDEDITVLKNKSLLRDRDRIEAINILREGGLMDDSLLFIVADHGDMKGEHGERGHGQKEGSWWNEKALIPFFACYLGQESKMNQYHHAPQLASLVDIAPTWMSSFEWDTPLAPEVYSNGMSIAVPITEADRTANRTVVGIARYFPRKDKINALINRERKLWFRVSSFDRATKHMRFRPEFFSDINDEVMEGCPVTGVQERMVQLQDAKGNTPVTDFDTRCQTRETYRDLLDFNTTFWRFFELA